MRMAHVRAKGCTFMVIFLVASLLLQTKFSSAQRGIFSFGARMKKPMDMNSSPMDVNNAGGGMKVGGSEGETSRNVLVANSKVGQNAVISKITKQQPLPPAPKLPPPPRPQEKPQQRPDNKQTKKSNMMMDRKFPLQRFFQQQQQSENDMEKEEDQVLLLWSLGLSIMLVILLFSIHMVAFDDQRQKKSSPPMAQIQDIPMPSWMSWAVLAFGFLLWHANRWLQTQASFTNESSVNILTIISAVIICFGMLIAHTVALSSGDVLKINLSLEEHEDFVIEDGHVKARHGLEAVDVAFEGFRMTLQRKKDVDRVLLDGSPRGVAKAGRMLAIMGPSGAGKSIFLHALAGRVKESSKLSLYGRRYVNDEVVSPNSMIPSAFIEQEVSFFPHMTVKETLSFRVDLKMGSLLSKSDREELVDDLMDQVNLKKAADSRVGDAKIRGISGGERKRLSIAVEMISSPSVIFLDEPTSGLDSAAAAALVQSLRKLADSGKTIIAVIHQPSQYVFSQFDDLMLLSEGKQMYFGEVKNVRQYMESHGFPAEDEVGSAEFVLECISKIPRVDESEEEAIERLDRLAGFAREQTVKLGKAQVTSKALSGGSKTDVEVFTSHHGTGGPRANIFVQLKLLLQRSLNDAFRGKAVLFVKIIQQVTVGVIYGGIYKLGLNQASIQDRFGLMSLITIGVVNLAVSGTIRAFPKEKAIVSNEIATKMYRTFPYFVGKALSDLPLVMLYNGLFGVIIHFLCGLNSAAGKFQKFLGLVALNGMTGQSLGLTIGAISPNSDVALAMFPAVLVLNIIFDGRNISVENTPRVLRWIAKVGLIRWGFEGLCINEFEGLTFETSGPRRGPVAKTGRDALSILGIGEVATLADVVKAQCMIMSGCWFLSYVGMTLTGQRFLPMQDPSRGDASSSA